MRRAFTLAETVVAAALCAMLVSIVVTLYLGAARGTHATLEATDALRSALIASEAIRRDVGEMLFQLPARDLVIGPDHKSLAIRVAGSLPEDYYKADYVGLLFRLQPITGSSQYHLLRDHEGKSEPVAGCLLSDLQFQFIAAEEPSPLRAFLQVTLVGSGSGGATTYTYSMFLPLSRMRPPEPQDFGDAK